MVPWHGRGGREHLLVSWCPVLLSILSCIWYTLVINVDVWGHLHVSELSRGSKGHVRFDRWRAGLTVKDV